MTSQPASPVVIYDDSCAFCRRQVTRIKAWDPSDQFEYLPRDTPGIEERFPKLAEGDFATGMRLVEPSGSIAVGADAVYAIARRLPVTRWLAWLYKVPLLHTLFRNVYAWIAANRQRLARDCDDGACEVPTPPRSAQD